MCLFWGSVVAFSARAASQLPVISVQPQGQTAAAGTPVTLSVAVADEQGVTYEWWNEFGPLYPSQTNALLNLPAVDPGYSGSYKVQVRNHAGTVTSASATLTVTSGDVENVLVARSGIGTGIDPGGNLDLDAAGNVYAAGAFSGSVTFGSFTLNSAGGTDAFIVKIDRSGSVVWARRAGGAGNDTAAGVAVDRMGNVHITGSFTGNADFGGQTVIGGAAQRAFAAMFDRNGNLLWVRPMGGTGTSRGGRIASDAAGNSVVLGAFTGSASLGGTTLASAGGPDVFIAKFSASGTPLWTRRFGGPGIEQGTGLSLDPAGNALVTGSFQETAGFGAFSLSSELETQTFIVKCDRAGAVLWVRNIAGVDSAAGTTVVAEEDGSSDLTGTFSGTTTIGTTSLTNRE
ncbi:MAG: large repetitive protein, partial [Verrucomicrobiota bacterium]